MADFEFSFTGKLEVDADSLGVAVANSVRTQPNGGGEIDVEYGLRFRQNPSEALEALIQQGFSRIVQEKLAPLDAKWEILDMKAQAEEMPQ